MRWDVVLESEIHHFAPETPGGEDGERRYEGGRGRRRQVVQRDTLIVPDLDHDFKQLDQVPDKKG